MRKEGRKVVPHRAPGPSGGSRGRGLRGSCPQSPKFAASIGRPNSQIKNAFCFWGHTSLDFLGVSIFILSYRILIKRFITPPPVGGRGIVIKQFLCLFLCQQHYEKMAGPICVGRCGVTMGRPDGSIQVNGSAGRRSSCLLSLP